MADIIRFDTGVKTFDLNGACTVAFCPTDLDFIERVYSALENMDKRQDGYKEVAAQTADKDVFLLARKMDSEAREEINGIFGKDVCSALFGTMNVFAVADGFPVWANFLLALIEQFEGAYAAEKRKTNPRIEKYTAKYAKK